MSDFFYHPKNAIVKLKFVNDARAVAFQGEFDDVSRIDDFGHMSEISRSKRQVAFLCLRTICTVAVPCVTNVLCVDDMG